MNGFRIGWFWSASQSFPGELNLPTSDNWHGHLLSQRFQLFPISPRPLTGYCFFFFFYGGESLIQASLIGRRFFNIFNRPIKHYRMNYLQKIKIKKCHSFIYSIPPQPRAKIGIFLTININSFIQCILRHGGHHHLTIVAHGDIQDRIVQWLVGSFCTRDVEVTPSLLSEVKEARPTFTSWFEFGVFLS